MLREVVLYGHLGKRFGRVHRFDVASPAEAIAALKANFKDFEAHVLAHNLPGYRVLVGKRGLTKDQLRLPTGDADAYKFVPVVAGAKRAGIGQIILGALLIVVGYFSFGATTKIGAGLIAGGVGSILGGVITLLTPKPPGPKERPENDPSYFFDGAVNTTAQGQPVPVLFGRLVVGSAVIGTGINAEEIAQPSAPPPPGGGWPRVMPAEQSVVFWEVGGGA